MRPILELDRGLTPADRADIVCRVFQHKVKDFVKFLKEVKTFGRVVGVLYTMEFQKRGLPHCHTLLWVDLKNKITDASHIDEYIFAELPDPVKDPRGYKVVSELMLHGPCGAANLSAPCTQNGTCNKKFPKRFNANTFFDSNGHTQYRRRDTGTYFMKHESRLDNCNVMPYNRVLCLAFEAHINVEYCGWRVPVDPWNGRALSEYCNSLLRVWLILRSPRAAPCVSRLGFAATDMTKPVRLKVMPDVGITLKQLATPSSIKSNNNPHPSQLLINAANMLRKTFPLQSTYHQPFPAHSKRETDCNWLLREVELAQVLSQHDKKLNWCSNDGT
ncbi:DNA helicase [Tanacetum coccineum]